MKRGSIIFLIVILSALLLSAISNATEIEYNRNGAISYADAFCKDYNHDEYKCWNGSLPECENYPGSRVDCANFASQALIDGGLNFGCVKGADIIGKDGATKGEITVAQLKSALQNSFCFEEITDPLKAQPGDILSWKSGSHVAVYGGDNKYYGHTEDRCNYTYEGLWDDVVIYQFLGDDKCQECKRNEKTCKAKLNPKCEGCSTCDSSIGECKSECDNSLGRCSASSSCECKIKDGEHKCECERTGPSGDCPDDTLTVASQPQTGEVMDEDPSSSVGVLDVGYTYDTQKLLSSFGEDIRALLPSEVSPSLAQNMPLLIIPTGGLNGMENSEFFKVALDEYVKQGGSILVLSQQHGYEFSVLPVPEEADGTYKTVQGYGWAEDQSCQANSSYIDTWHNVLAGQTKSTPSLNVDGYFTSYPDNTTVLLRRTTNGQPAVILYPYGNGYIIASSIYTDWAYATGQSSEDERRLIRDIVSWLVKPDSLQEIDPGQGVTLDISIANNDTTETTTAVEVEILDPDRKERKLWTSIPITLAPNESTQIPVSFTSTTTDPLGIYHVKYGLMAEGYELLTSELDPEGTNVWVPYLLQIPVEEPSGRFVISNPPAHPYDSPDFDFSIQSDAEYYIYGSPATFTVIAWNNTDNDALITFKYTLAHLGPGRSRAYGSYDVNVPAQSSTSFNIVVPEVEYMGWLAGYFYDESGKHVGYANKGIWMVHPNVSVTVQTDKSFYAKGETVSINTFLKNKVFLSWQANFKITITDSENIKVFEDTEIVSLSPNETSTVTTSFILPQNSTMGTYTVRLELHYGVMIASKNSTKFELPLSQISVTPNTPFTLSEGTNILPFSIVNKGSLNVSSGTLDISLEDPDGAVVYSGSQSFSIDVGETLNLNVPITVPPLKLGMYKLTLTQSDETRQGRLTYLYVYNNIYIADYSFDKTSYKVRETANLTAAITNAGKFNLENVPVTVSMPDANYTNTQTVSLPSSSIQELTYAIPIPDTITSAGAHYGDITLTLSSGDTIQGSFTLWLQSPSIVFDISGTSYTAGDTVDITLKNTGGIDASVTNWISLTDNHGNITYEDYYDNTILAGGEVYYSFQIPPQVVEGSYDLYFESLDSVNGGLLDSIYETINISGLKASLSIKTDKDIYLLTEEVNSLSTISTETIGIVDGNLHLKVEKTCIDGGGPPILESIHVSSIIGGEWVEFGELHFGPEFTTQELDTSGYLPGDEGYKLDFYHDGSGYAFVDYIALRDLQGNIYAPSFAYLIGVDLFDFDITSEVADTDGIAAEVSGMPFGVQWDDVPPGTTGLTLIMTAKEESYCLESPWATDITVNQLPLTTDTINTLIGTLGDTGKFYLKGTLSNSLGQEIAYAEYPFYVIDGDFAFILLTDKRIYKLGETVTITGEVKNLSAIQADGVYIELKDKISGLVLYSATADIPAQGSYQFTTTTTADTEGVYNLRGTAEQNSFIIAEVLEQYEVSVPVVAVSVSMPEVVGNELFNINLEFINEGKIDADIQYTVISSTGDTIDDQQLTIPAEEIELIQYQQQISQDTDFTFTFTGDLEQTITETVSYGLAASITINPQPTYLEGNIAIPVTMTNTGQLEESLEVNFQLSQQSSIVSQQSKIYYIPIGESVTDTLYFNLAEGDYQLTASSQLPVVSSQADFSVQKDINVDVTISVGTQSNNLIPVTVNLTNLGYSEFNGSVRLSVVDNQGKVVWNSEQSVSQLLPSGTQVLTFNINSSALEPANYTLKAEVFDNNNNQITQSTKQLTIQGPIFQITQLPAYQTVYPDDEATFTFTVKNTGNQEGAVELNFNAYDLIESAQTEWLTPEEEKSITFSFTLPDDLEEKDYFADYELKDVDTQQLVDKGQVKYHFSGINLGVNASLDKQNYNQGDIAYLTLQITDNRAQVTELNLFAMVNYADNNLEQVFTLNGSETITFDIPLTEITGEKLFYGIYYESGRSIHLNSLYIYEEEDALSIITDKQVYNPFENVIITLTGNTSGTLTLTAIGYEETFEFSGTATRSFTLSFEMTAGTYFVNAELQTLDSELITLSHPFDVTGLSVKVKETTLDKSKYASSDTLKLRLTIESNQDIPAILKTWIIDPEGEYTSAGESNINLSSLENTLITHISFLSTTISGIHRLAYSIYSGDLLLVSGAEAFDVGEAVLLGLSTDKTDYPSDTEPVIATVSAYGTVDAFLELQIDDSTIITHSIIFNSTVTLSFNIGSVEPGTHNLKAILTTAGGLTSTKETIFTYAFIPNQPPVADAGEDIVIYLGATAILDGSVSYDPDNQPQPLTYQWSFVEVPADSYITDNDLYGANTVSPSFIPDVTGAYELELMLSDGQDFAYDNAVCSVVYLSPNPDFFLPPVKNNKVFKLGSTIPVKFQLTDAYGAYISDAVATISLQQYSASEPVEDPVDATSTSGADSGNFFRYDSDDDQYIYNLSTKSLSTGTWLIIVELDDGTTRTVFIGLK